MSNLEHFLENGLALIENGVRHDEFINIMSSDPNKPYVELSAEGLWEICTYIYYYVLPGKLSYSTSPNQTPSRIETIDRVINRADVVPGKEAAVEMLKSCGVLSEHGEINKAYSGIMYKKKG